MTQNGEYAVLYGQVLYIAHRAGRNGESMRSGIRRRKSRIRLQEIRVIKTDTQEK